MTHVCFLDITRIKVNNDHHFKFHRGEISQGIFHHETTHILFDSNGLATWYGFPEITHFQVENCHMSAIFNLIEF